MTFPSHPAAGRRSLPPGTFHEVGPVSLPGFDGARALRVFVPFTPNPALARPLLVLFDGQNVFGDEGSFAGGWHADQAVCGLTGAAVLAPIVVGIPHGGVGRMDELTPWKISDESGGRLDEFLDGVVGTVIPEVRARWNVIPGAVGAVIGGSSLGGLAALYAHFRHPEAFGGAVAMSPSLWVAGGRIFDYLRQRPRPLFSRVYVDCGGREAKGQMLPKARELAEELAQRGWGREQLLWRPDQRGGHNELAWRRRLPKALRFMFRR